MNLHLAQETQRRAKASGSILVIVLWVALGLVTITLYFASSMSFELRASDNRVSAMAADQAIDAAARYVSLVLSAYNTNGTVPDVSLYQSEAVPVGDAHFWLIGRPVDYQVQPDQVFFGLVDEGSKVNVNVASADILSLLTNVTPELAANIFDWHSTNGTPSENGDGPTVYSMFQPPYYPKSSAYETVDELRLVYPMDMGTLLGEDYNRNGALDPSEMDTNRNGWVDPGILEYVTVYSREPNTLSDGSSRISIRPLDTTQLRSLLETNLSADRVSAIMNSPALGGSPAGARPGTGGTGAAANSGARPGGTSGANTTATAAAAASTPSFNSPLAFYLASGMTSDEFGLISKFLTVTNGSFITGRINVNTAAPAVLACLPGMTSDLSQQLISYRQQNQDKLTSVAWVVDALGTNNNSVIQALGAGDYITTESYQFTADVAALGPYGRGYRRVKFVFDTSSGTPTVVYRQDLSHLGWALGKYVRDTWLIAKDSR